MQIYKSFSFWQKNLEIYSAPHCSLNSKNTHSQSIFPMRVSSPWLPQGNKRPTTKYIAGMRHPNNVYFIPRPSEARARGARAGRASNGRNESDPKRRPTEKKGGARASGKKRPQRGREHREAKPKGHSGGREGRSEGAKAEGPQGAKRPRSAEGRGRSGASARRRGPTEGRPEKTRRGHARPRRSDAPERRRATTIRSARGRNKLAAGGPRHRAGTERGRAPQTTVHF